MDAEFIYNVINLYEDGIHSSPEAIINHLGLSSKRLERKFIYRIIYNYRCNLEPINNYIALNGGLNKKKLLGLLEPMWHFVHGDENET